MTNTGLQSIIQRWLAAGVVFSTALLLAACGSASDSDQAYVVKIGSSTLTIDQLRQAMPAGLSPEDSTLFVHAYVLEWINEHLISEVAVNEVDLTEIDRLTAEYRNRLILTEYKRKMYQIHADSISEDSIETYYNEHKREFTLQRPLVRGVYLKVPNDAANLRTLRRLYKSDKPVDIDRLEKEVLTSAIHYDYFRNRWVDWEQIESRIPYTFGTSPDSWLASNHSLDASLGGFTYLLFITEVIPSGKPMPLDAAREQIVNRLTNLNRIAYEKALLRDLYQQASEEGTLKLNIKLD